MVSSSSSTAPALTKTTLPETETLKFVSSGKVRDLYVIQNIRSAVDDLPVDDEEESYLLFVATDRISAYDVILKNGVPGKGKLLTQISIFWFNRLKHIIENHVVSSTLQSMPKGVRKQIEPYWETHGLDGRTLLVKRAKVVKLEAIVRGYLTGSGWSEYKKKGTVHGIPLRGNYVESSKLDEPIFTPSTKADLGEHDENISPDQARELLGNELYKHVSEKAVELYKEASAYALTRGLILADTKFEFGLIPLPSNLSLTSKSSPSPIITLSTPTGPTPYKLILIDEALTPDSSRYWSAEAYEPGRSQASFDKQFLRDWLVESGFKKGVNDETGPDGHGWSMNEEVLSGTSERYEKVVKLLLSE